MIYINITFFVLFCLNNADFISCRGRWNSVTQTQKIVHYCCFLISIQILAGQWDLQLKCDLSERMLYFTFRFNISVLPSFSCAFSLSSGCSFGTNHFTCSRWPDELAVTTRQDSGPFWNRSARTFLSLVLSFACKIWLRSWVTTLQQKNLSTSRKNMLR